MIDVYEIIKQISTKKKGENIFPDYALFTEVCGDVNRQVKQEINNLVKANKLRYHKTINSLSFEVLEEDKEEKQE